MAHRPEFQSREMHQVMVAYLDLLRFQVRLAADMRRQTGQPIRMFDTVVNLETYLFASIGGTLQQEIINSLDAPRSSTRESLARLVRAGLVARDGYRYKPSESTLGIVDEVGDELLRLIARVCDAASAYEKVYGRLPPI